MISTMKGTTQLQIAVKTLSQTGRTIRRQEIHTVAMAGAKL